MILQAIVYVESQSVLAALSSLHVSKSSLVGIDRKYKPEALHPQCTIVHCWFASHVGIRKNEKADQLAISSRHLDETIKDLPYQDFYVKLRFLIQKE